jgi:hypothetical protein
MADPWPPFDWQALPTETLSDGVFIRDVQLSKPIAPRSGASGRRNRAACRRAAGFLSGVWALVVAYSLHAAYRARLSLAEIRGRARTSLRPLQSGSRPCRGFACRADIRAARPSLLGGALVGTGGYRHRHRTTRGCRSAPRTTRVASVYDRFGIQPILSTFGDEKGGPLPGPGSISIVALPAADCPRRRGDERANEHRDEEVE